MEDDFEIDKETSQTPTEDHSLDTGISNNRNNRFKYFANVFCAKKYRLIVLENHLWSFSLGGKWPAVQR